MAPGNGVYLGSNPASATTPSYCISAIQIPQQKCFAGGQSNRPSSKLTRANTLHYHEVTFTALTCYPKELVMAPAPSSALPPPLIASPNWVSE